MDRVVAISLDVVAVLIVLCCTVAAAKKGFVRTVVQLAAYVGILFIASALSKSAAPILYDRVVEPALFGKTTSQTNYMPNASLAASGVRFKLLLTEKAEDVKLFFEDLMEQGGLPEELQSLFDLIYDVGDQAPDLQSLIELLPEGFDVEYWAKRLPEGNMEEIRDELFSELLSAAIRPVAVEALKVVCFVAVFFILSLAANLLLFALGIIRYLPVIGRVNAFLGGVVGALQGLMLVWLVALLIQGVLALTNGSWWMITNNILQDTFLFQYFLFIPEFFGK